jgi:hypothetical protein
MHSDREAQLLVRLARVRAKVADLVEELSEAGLNLTAGRVESTLVILDAAKQTLMSAIRDAGEAAGRKR